MMTVILLLILISLDHFNLDHVRIDLVHLASAFFYYGHVHLMPTASSIIAMIVFDHMDFERHDHI